jgi:hypothetical protein
MFLPRGEQMPAGTAFATPCGLKSSAVVKSSGILMLAHRQKHSAEVIAERQQGGVNRRPRKQASRKRGRNSYQNGFQVGRSVSFR